MYEDKLLSALNGSESVKTIREMSKEMMKTKYLEMWVLYLIRKRSL